MNRWIRAAAFAVALGLAQSVQAAPASHAANPHKRPLTRVAAVPSPEVRDVAANPAAHLGRLSLSGVVGIVTPHKSFVLVDMREYQGEGLACLTTPERTKIPVVWSGVAPKVKQAVRVTGTLAKTAKGYSFTADEVKP
jgi:hypothetical protein